jgi:hypothetical protein
MNTDDIIEMCAQAIEPKGSRPCDCEKGCRYFEHCGSIKVSAVEEWDTKADSATAIRALKGTIDGTVCEKAPAYQGWAGTLYRAKQEVK